MENVVVVFPKLDDGNKIKAVLVKNGINVDYVCTSGAQALEYVNKLNEGIVVCSYRFTDMYYTQLKEDLPDGFEMLLVASKGTVMVTSRLWMMPSGTVVYGVRLRISLT